ncbi:hypothetical protein [Alteromonas facilis]|uniref:hypothetical protein n=1 Tax=Alteromonas facilis TaxID=2048004 RepID=UPI000F5D3DE6|nr:hypothetical protein [Alteromonas facilis]
MKFKLITTGLLALSATFTSVAATNYANLSKELEIMDSVLVTSLRQSSNESMVRFRSIETSYLAGQGVVFEVNTSRRGWGIELDIRQFIPSVPVAPAAPVMRSSDEDGMSFEVSEEWEEYIENTVQSFEDAFRANNEQMRDVRDNVRDLEWETRELERRQRDLNFELRTAVNERKAEVEEELKQIRKEAAKLEEKKQELNKYAETIEAEQKEQVEKQRLAKEQANKAFLSSFEDMIGDTLCRFGAGLRALPKDEHISFVLKEFDTDERRKAQDRVYVFAQSQIRACVQEKIDAKELLAQAVVYNF